MWKKATVGRGIVIFVLAVVGLIFLVVNRETIIHYFSEEKTEEMLPDEAQTSNSEKIKEKSEDAVEDEEARGNDLMPKPDEAVADDVRIHGFPYIKLTNRLQAGDYVDVRISFADGGDFVLLSKKRVQGIEPLGEEGTNSIWFTVSEEEILRLSSAVVDAYLNEGCSIYAIQYVSETQKEAVVNYVVSDLVKELIEENPNIVKKAENVVECSLWKEYKKNIQRERNVLASYEAKTEKETVLTDSRESSEQVYPEQEEIIYLD